MRINIIKIMSLLLFILFYLVCNQAFCGTNIALEFNDTIEIEIDVFSGRVNPSFFLSPGDFEYNFIEKEMNDAITDTGQKINPGNYSSADSPKLGYRGVIIKKNNPKDGNLEYISISNGKIKIFEDNYDVADSETPPGTFLMVAEDENRMIENYLIDLAIEKGIIDRDLLK